jgi:hypothetical protein
MKVSALLLTVAAVFTLHAGANTLSNDSPRDTGLLTGAPAFDFEGDARPQGPAFDIGRDEYVP